VITGNKAAIDFADSAGAIRVPKSGMADISDFNFRRRLEAAQLVCQLAQVFEILIQVG
jgi:hypothetical protein